MLKFLFFFFLFFILIRYINRLFLPSIGRQNKPDDNVGRKRSPKNHFDEIEDAEFEDLSDKNKEQL